MAGPRAEGEDYAEEWGGQSVGYEVQCKASPKVALNEDKDVKEYFQYFCEFAAVRVFQPNQVDIIVIKRWKFKLCHTMLHSEAPLCYSASSPPP